MYIIPPPSQLIKISTISTHWNFITPPNQDFSVVSNLFRLFRKKYLWWFPLALCWSKCHKTLLTALPCLPCLLCTQGHVAKQYNLVSHVHHRGAPSLSHTPDLWSQILYRLEVHTEVAGELILLFFLYFHERKILHIYRTLCDVLMNIQNVQCTIKVDIGMPSNI